MNYIKKTIRDYLKKEIGSDFETINDDENLFEIGVIDSIVMVEMVLFLEESFAIEFDVMNLDFVEFSTIYKIAENIFNKINN